ncbi:MAG: hypothetical protein ACI3XJ_02540 [Oscillospiraceae bacterium]
MARLIINTQNALFADMLKRTLRKGGDFTVYVVDQPENVLAEVRRIAAEIVLLEVTANTPWKLEERMKLRDSIRKTDPDCKIVFLVDENIDPKIAEDVKNAKLLGLIDQFIFSSISASYLAALMETL